jgi:hypothetical protein
LYLVRWRNLRWKWKQRAFSDRGEADLLVETIISNRGKPGPFNDVSSFVARFAEGDSLDDPRLRRANHGMVAGRYLVKWKLSGNPNTHSFLTEDEARAYHRFLWMSHARRDDFYLNPRIHMRLT